MPGAQAGRAGGSGSGSSVGSVRPRLGVVAEQVLLDPVRQPGDARRRAAGLRRRCRGRRAGSGRAGRSSPASVGRGGQGGGAAQRGEVVQPDLDRDGAAGEAVLAQPLGDLAGLPGEQALHQLAVGQVGVVGALDADRLGLPLGDRPAGRPRRARAGAGPCPCARPTSRTSSSRLTVSRSATVWMPARRSRSAVAGPTPGITVTCIGRSRSCSVPGGTTTSPSGFSRSLATLAMNFEVPMPTDAVSPPVDLGDTGPQLLGDARSPRHVEVGQVGRAQVDEGLVQRERLDQGGERRAAAPSPPRWCPGRRGSDRRGRPRAGSAPGPPASTWPSGRRTGGPRRTPSPPRPGRRRRRRPPACRAGTACRAARRRRRTRPGPGGAPTRPAAWWAN